MKKAYSLDYSIERDVDRVQAIYDILDTLNKNPTNTELEQMANYILYGKDEEGKNAKQRGEMTDDNKRYNSFKTADEKLLSLDEILENPATDERELQSANKRSVYKRPKPTISKPKYNKKTGELIDPGDSDIPGMQQLWDDIARVEHIVAVNEGKVPYDDHTPLLKDSYRLYQLKHQLIDMRRHQYYLKDIFKPTLHFAGADHPKTQFVDWTADAFYWISRAELDKKIANSLTSRVSRNIEDYEVRQGPDGEPQYKWMVQPHTFDWENPNHIKHLINQFDGLYDQLHEKLDTYGYTLLLDFERYRAMAHLSDARSYILDQKLARAPYGEIVENLQIRFGIKYTENYLCTILAKEIPEKIACAAQRHRLLIETPADKRKKCATCGRELPKHKLFFCLNKGRKDGYSSSCKECERNKRIEGGQSTHDRRNKETQVHEMQARET